MLGHLDRNELDQHVTVLGWLHLGMSLLVMVIGVFIFTLMGGIGVIADAPEAQTILGIVGGTLFTVSALLSLPGLVVGYGLLKRRPWARIAAIVVSLLIGLHFPIGTLLGVYTLWAMSQVSAKDYFALESEQLGE